MQSGRLLREKDRGNEGCTYDQVAKKDLEDLGLQACPTCKYALEDANQNVAHGRRDKGAKGSHLRYTRREVMAILIPVLCNPRGEKFLGCRERGAGQHLGAKRVGLELLEVCL